MKKVLILQSRKICYGSLYVFAECMCRAFHNLGIEADLLALGRDLTPLTTVMNEYDTLVDFNSTLPLAKDAEGQPLLKGYRGDFFNYLLDHPVYYYEPLSAKEIRQTVLCIDREHVQYLKRYHPHLEAVIFLPLGAMPVEEDHIKSMEDRKLSLLFTGTYTRKEQLEQKLSLCNSDLQKETLQLADIMETEEISLPEAMQLLCEEYGLSLTDEKAALMHQLHFVADYMVAARYREEVVTAIVEAGLPITLCGYGWSRFEGKAAENVTILPERGFREAADLAYDCRILVNVMPWFQDGMHDRILTGLGHGAVVFTGSNPYLREIDREGCLISYSRKTLKADVEKLAKLLQDKEQLSQLADRGRMLAGRFTWEEMLSSLLQNKKGM